MRAWVKKYELQFHQTVQTSRASYSKRTVWFLFLEQNGIVGIGECAPIPGLSRETIEEVEALLTEICLNPDKYIGNPKLISHISSLSFALESARLDLDGGGEQIIYPSPFTKGEEGIPINGLIWMGAIPFMQSQIDKKTEEGYSCIKFKIGNKMFDKEFELLQTLRERYDEKTISIRLDANGAFAPEEALEKLDRLATLKIHSIEQPIQPGNIRILSELCNKSPIPIALDEELISIDTIEKKRELLQKIKPSYLVLKPGLHGGFSGCSEWISLAEQYNIGWWITSYLESNIGLNAIAQWTYHKRAKGHQGLGTGSLFSNNFPSPLEIKGESLWYRPNKHFILTSILNKK